MRRAALLIACACFGAACRGHGGGDDGAKQRVAPIAGEDESCNPATPKVCRGEDVIECAADGHLGRRLRACHDGCRDGRCELTCSDDGAQLIYVVDTANELLSFDPRKLGSADPFKLVGHLDCPDLNGQPFSMSVDRHGIAWVLYSDGHLFRVAIDDAKCAATGFQTFAVRTQTFGMGFATDGAGARTEKLYVASNSADSFLFAIDTANLQPQLRGSISATQGESPELTGTADARLYGFYPVSTGEPFVQEIDRATGAPVGPRWPVAGEPLDISAYAFAQWGGTFYIFATVGGSSTVRAVDKTGHFKLVLQDLPYRITGAGVSTCAPERDQ